MAQLSSLTVNDTGSLTLPSGTLDNRPGLSSTVVVQWTNTGTQAVSVLSGSATTTTTSWTCPTGVTSVEALVVAGGGAGGGYHGGGGGAGGVIYNSAFPVTPGTSYTVTVGPGGTAATQVSNTGNAGSNSVFATLTAIGGGAGLSQGNTPQARNNGGSGGGASDNNSGTFTTGGAGTAGQGHAGGGYFGDGTNSVINYATSGGGGAGGPGGGHDSVYGGFGGPGLCFDISGSPTYYGGGGGGTQLGNTGYFSASVATYGLGGVGGGGNGGYTSTSGGAAVRNSSSGVNGTGGGGGGFLYSNLGGGAGGSGTVIIRYALATATTQPTGQTRFNTITKTFENYETSNKWKTAPVRENIVTDGLVAHLDGSRYGSSTTWTDLSGLNNHATLTNGPTYTADNGGAIVFDGSNDHAISGTFTQHQTTRITLSAWVYPTQVSNDSYVISVGGGANGNARGIRVNGGVWSAIGYGSGSTEDYNETGATAIVNRWQHVCAVWDGTTVTFYLNGRVTGTTTRSGLVTPVGSAYYIGLPSWSTSAAWTGRIACASIYKKSLTQNEVRQNYDAQRSRFELTNPVTDQQAYVTDRLAINIDLNDPACCPTLANGITSAKLNDSVNGTQGSMGNGAIPVATPNYKFVKLDGTNDYISMSNPNIYLGTNHSYDFWIYVTGIKDATYARAYIIDLRGDGGDGGSSSYFLWDYQSAGNVVFTTGNGGSEVLSSTVPLSVNTWHHMATTRDGATWKIYLDGALVGTGTSNFTALSLTNAYRIGMYSGWGFSTVQYALPGYVGAARIYTKTLSSGEVMTNYQAMKNRYGS